MAYCIRNHVVVETLEPRTDDEISDEEAGRQRAAFARQSQQQHEEAESLRQAQNAEIRKRLKEVKAVTDDDIEDAVALMEAGRTEEAVALSSAAIDAVLASRDGVVEPLWEAQFYLTEQIAGVRSRLAASLSTGDPDAAEGQIGRAHV